MSEEIQTAEDVYQYLAELDQTQPIGGWRETEEREIARRREREQRERERQAHEARKVEAKQQREVANNWDAWYAAIDRRIEQHFLSGHLGVGGALKDAIGDTIGMKCAEVRKECKHLIEKAVAELKERPSRLPVARLWQPTSVTYEAQVVSHEGASYQALRDTATTPPGSDWVLVARGGVDGRDGLTLNVRGMFDAYKKYRRLDVIEFDGSSFVALCDLDPGVLPGEDGWQLLARVGQRGPAGDAGPCGERGVRGARGKTAPTIASWTLDRVHYRAVPTMSDGTQGAVLELRGLFEQFCDEALGPAIDVAVTQAALKDAARG